MSSPESESPKQQRKRRSKTEKPPETPETAQAQPTPDLLYKFNNGHEDAYNKDDVIFRQGELSAAVYYIREGEVRITVLSDHGKEATLGLLHPGDFIGEASMSGESTRGETAACLSQCKLVKLNVEQMRTLLTHDPAFMGVFMQFLLARNMSMSHALADQYFNNSRKRLARTLIMLAQYRTSQSGPLNLPQRIDRITHIILATMIFTTRSRTSEFMSDFQKRGYITDNGDNTITVNRGILDVLMEEPGQ